MMFELQNLTYIHWIVCVTIPITCYWWKCRHRRSVGVYNICFIYICIYIYIYVVSLNFLCRSTVVTPPKLWPTIVALSGLTSSRLIASLYLKGVVVWLKGTFISSCASWAPLAPAIYNVLAWTYHVESHIHAPFRPSLYVIGSRVIGVLVRVAAIL